MIYLNSIHSWLKIIKNMLAAAAAFFLYPISEELYQSRFRSKHPPGQLAAKR